MARIDRMLLDHRDPEWSLALPARCNVNFCRGDGRKLFCAGTRAEVD
jgi:hypothetical protein